MVNKEKALGGAVTPGRAAQVVGDANKHFTTSESICQLSDYLSTGRENAHTAREIADWMCCQPRDVTRQIERSRLHGAPICATCNVERPGYYLAKDAEELSNYLQRFKHRRRTIARTEAALLTTLCAMKGQRR